jgi:hypothetical protein
MKQPLHEEPVSSQSALKERDVGHGDVARYDLTLADPPAAKPNGPDVDQSVKSAESPYQRGAGDRQSRREKQGHLAGIPRWPENIRTLL